MADRLQAASFKLQETGHKKHDPRREMWDTGSKTFGGESRSEGNVHPWNPEGLHLARAMPVVADATAGKRKGTQDARHRAQNVGCKAEDDTCRLDAST
jgi:hypothetical protein